MVNFHKALLLSGLLMLLVTGASAVTFVINDGDASVSLAASPNHDVAFSVVAADNPESYSASMSAGDGGGASASQESDIGGADRIFSATAGISSDGDYAYTFTETAVGSTETSQQAQASQGNGASASQDTISIAVAGAATSNGTEIDKTTASQSVAFILGINNVNLSGSTANNASAYQKGVFAGIAGNTLGIARPISGDFSFTRACIAAGGMTFDNSATTDSETTSVAQDVGLAGVFGSASAVAIDNEGPLASQSAMGIGGILCADQSATTDASATAAQSGTFAGLIGGTLGLGMAPDSDISDTRAGVFIGGMTFDGTTVAEETTTTASQKILQAGLLGSAHTGSMDQNGNIAAQDSGFVAGILSTDQNSDTLGSANAVQTGGFAGLGGMTNGFALSAEGDISHTNAGVFAGGMIFDDSATAEDTATIASQAVGMAGLAGSASADSDDGVGNVTDTGAGLLLGTLGVMQQTDTSGSSHSAQLGGMSAGLGTTWGDATSDTEQSWTDAGVVVGTMTFGNAATADGSTEAGQIVGITGNVLPGAVAGRASAGSDDGAGNVTEAGAGIILGNLGIIQQTDTRGSAHSAQLGGMSAGLGTTWGDALSGGEQSWTDAGVIIGTMTFGNRVAADGDTEAGQVIGMSAAGGQASAGSNDGTGNVTETGAGIILGDLGIVQQTDTSSSAHTAQIGILSAGLGNTWGEAASGAEQSWTDADVVVGGLAFGNAATANGNTNAGQVVGITGLAGEASAGSNDGRGNATEVGAGVIIGNLGVIQQTDTSGSAYSAQLGALEAAYGYTSGNAASADEQSWTDADVVIGNMAFGNSATADGDTRAGQFVGLSGLAGEASAGSVDGAGNVTEVGSGVVLGDLDSIQLTDTANSAHSAQLGGMSAGLGTTWGDAASGGEQSWTESHMAAGSMFFGNSAIANGDSQAGQVVGMTALIGQTAAGSDDGSGNATAVGSGIVIGDLDTIQLTDTSGSAHSTQQGALNAVYGNTWGYAASGTEQSWTDANVIVGTMNYGNGARADGDTQSGQIVGLSGLAGETFAGSDDGAGNITEVGSGVILGDLGVAQKADTSGSAHSAQLGDLSAAYGYSWGDATSGVEQSWTESKVVVGSMTFGNAATADGDTSAGQFVGLTGLAGEASAGSDGGAGNATEVGSGVILGSLGVVQQTDTSGSAHSAQLGDLEAAYGYTWGDATSGAEQSWTDAEVVVGGMTFGNAATADGDTSAGQFVGLTGLAGEASAGSDDGAGNTTDVGAGVILGSLGVVQQTDTRASAHSAQSGGLEAAYGYTWGDAVSGSEHSWTEAEEFVGTMSFSGAANAGNGTEAWQALSMTALSGEAAAGSDDGIGNVTGVGSGIVLGDLSVIQQTDTGGSAYSAQFGNLDAVSGYTWGDAVSGPEHSWMGASVLVGNMTFGNAASSCSSTEVGQIIGMKALAGKASVGSDDGLGKVTGAGAGIALGSLDVIQAADTSASAHSAQLGDLEAAYGYTWGDAVSGIEQSWTDADVLAGTMTFDNDATANSSTFAGQTLGMAGLAGNASVGSDDGLGNVTGEGTGFILGSLNASQSTDTSGSAHTSQFGNLAAALGTTWGDARSGSEHSWTDADVFIGTMTFDNSANSGTSAFAGQSVSIPIAVAANVSAGSDDGQGDVTGVGAGILGGSLNLTQTSGTGTSAQTSQSGYLTAVLGTTWGNATSGDGDQSWTSADVDTGTITLTNNNVYASDAGTSAGQTVGIDGLLGLPAVAGSVSVGSSDGTNSATVGAMFTAGYLGMDQQQTGTGASASASQSGTITAASGNTWGTASSGTSESWTAADVTIGTITLANNSVYAGAAGTSAGQTVGIDGLLGLPAGSGSASVGSTDGTNIATVGAKFTAGYLDMNQQQTGTGASASASQSGTITAESGKTWGTASSGTSESWTAADVTIGTITLANNSVYAGAAGTSAGQTVGIDGLLGLPAGSGSASVGSTDGTNVATVGAKFTAGYLDMNQQTGTGASVSASQSGTVTSVLGGTGSTWGNASSGTSEASWTSAEVASGILTTGTITMNNNTVIAGGSTTALQSLGISGTSGIAAVGSSDGTNTAEVGTEFTTGSLNMNQGTNAGASARATQAGTVSVILGGTGNTWGNASTGPSESSWTSAEVASGLLSTGTITMNNNTVYAGSDTTSAFQNLSISGPGGSAAVGSSDGTNTAEVGAKFTSGGLSMNQGTTTSANTQANQAGTITVVGGGTGSTWGNASSGQSGESSWTSSDVTAGLVFTTGTLTLNNNTVRSGSSTSALQSLSLSGISGSASVGSTDGPFYTQAGAGFTSGNLNMNQQASTGASANANQTGTVFTQAVTSNLGDAWTHTEAGDTSNNRQVYAETKARRTLSGSPTITVNSNAFGSLGNTTAYESKQRSGGGASTTYVYARNTGGTSTDSSNTGSTSAWAWATLANRYANV